MAIIEPALGFVTEILSRAVTNLVLATIILLLGFIFGRIAGSFSKKALGEIGLNRLIYNFVGLSFSLENLISAFITYFIYFMAIVLALNQFGASELFFNIIAFSIGFVVLLSMLLALKDFFPNLAAGIAIGRKSMLRKGDNVSIDGIEGKVLEVGFYMTKIESGKKEIVFIPNSTVIKSKVMHLREK